MKSEREVVREEIARVRAAISQALNDKKCPSNTPLLLGWADFALAEADRLSASVPGEAVAWEARRGVKRADDADCWGSWYSITEDQFNDVLTLPPRVLRETRALYTHPAVSASVVTEADALLDALEAAVNTHGCIRIHNGDYDMDGGGLGLKNTNRTLRQALAALGKTP